MSETEKEGETPRVIIITTQWLLSHPVLRHGCSVMAAPGTPVSLKLI